MLGKQFYLNACGKSVDDSGMRQIPRPRLELTTHITIKTIQSGGFLGTLIVGPIIALAKGQADKEGMKSWAETAGLYGSAVGLIAGPLLSIARLGASDVTTDNVWDKCYRIRYNRGQMRVDRLSFVGSVAGVAAASYLGESSTLGALIGMNTGMLLAFAFNCTFG